MVTVVFPDGLPWVGLMEVMAGFVPLPLLVIVVDAETVPGRPVVFGSVTVTFGVPAGTPHGTTKLPLIVGDASGLGGL